MERLIEQYFDFYVRAWRRRYLYAGMMFTVTVCYGSFATFVYRAESITLAYETIILVVFLMAVMPFVGVKADRSSESVSLQARRAEEMTSKHPPFFTMGTVLAEMAVHVECSVKDEAKWRPTFLSILRKAEDAFRDRLTAYKILVQLADKTSWPSWAVRCLPDLYAQLETLDDGRVVAYMSRYVAGGISPSYEYTIIERMCGGEIFKVVMPRATADLAKGMSDEISDYLRHNPNESDRSFIGTVITVWSQNENISRREQDIQAAEKLKFERKKVLIDENVMTIGAFAGG